MSALETQSQWWLVALLVYFAGIFLLAMLRASKYLKSEPLKIAKNPEHALAQFQYKEQESNVLTGFALVAIIFIITFFKDDTYSIARELLLAFFSLAFVFEIISSLFYRMINRGIHGFLGSLFQYGGVLSMIMGFGTFMFQIMNWSFYLNSIYLVGLFAVTILICKGFLDQITNWEVITSTILKISIRGFTPKTFGTKDNIARKIELRDMIRSKIDNLADMQSKFRGKRLSINADFYLYDDPNDAGRSNKDLDNLLKILCDVLPEHMDRGRQQAGLGLIENDRDDLIFKINCKKEIVLEQSQEGIDIEISEYS